jgi:hypothetical protein
VDPNLSRRRDVRGDDSRCGIGDVVVRYTVVLEIEDIEDLGSEVE